MRKTYWNISGAVHMGFTLIELLVVIAIIAILASLLMPALSSAKSKAGMIGCMGNLKQMSCAVGCYVNDYEGWLPHSGGPDLLVVSPRNWAYLLAPYMGVSEITKYSLTHKAFLCPKQTNVTCGNSTLGDDGFYGGYGWNYGCLGWRDTYFSGSPAWVKISSVVKPSETIAAGDTSDDSGAVYSFYLQYFDAAGVGSLCEASRHSLGGDYLWVDGHVSWKSANDVFKKFSWYYVNK